MFDDDAIIKSINRGMLVAYTATVIGGALCQKDVFQIDPVVASKVVHNIGTVSSSSGTATASVFIAQEFNNLITGDVYQGPYRQDVLERPAFIRERDYASWPLLASGSQAPQEKVRTVIDILWG